MRLPIILLIAAVALLGCNDLVSTSALDHEVSALSSAAKKPASALNSDIDYVFAGHLGTVDDAGRRLVWDGNISGDVNGKILWWFVSPAGPPNMPESAHVGFYEARWEVWDGEDLLLAGESAGSTALPPGKDGIWRGNGQVTEVSEGYEPWMNRQIKEGGNVNFVFPFSGAGFFRIN